VIQRLAELLSVNFMVAMLAASACADDRGSFMIGSPVDKNAGGFDKPASSAVLMAQAMQAPPPHTRDEKCAALRGQSGTDFYCASSVLAPQLGNTYSISNLFNNTTGEAWVAGKHGQGLGEWITIDFKELRLVKAVIIRNGYQKNPDIFSKNSRVRKLRLVFSQGETQTIVPQDNMDLQRIPLDPVVSAYWVQFIIDDVYPGSSYPDTAISKLFVTAEPVR
jgi:hypothetical protein